SGPQSASAATTLTVMVFDVPPTVDAGVNTAFDQGTEFVRSGDFTDSNPDSWTATVDYGDGSGTQPLALNSDKTFRLDHVYTTPGDYTVSMMIADSQGGVGHGYLAVQVFSPVAPGASGTETPAATPQPQTQPQPSAGPGQAPAAANPSSNGATGQTLSPLL